jgi:hypothetical protein
MTSVLGDYNNCIRYLGQVYQVSMTSVLGDYDKCIR